MIQWTGKNLKELIAFTGKSDRFDEWFPTWDDFEKHIANDGNRFKIIKPEGNAVALVGDWIYTDTKGQNQVTNNPMAPLIFVTNELAMCNQFSIKGFKDWPDIAPFNINELNEQATRLLSNYEDILTFIDGEESEVAEITEALNLSELNAFLNEVFDGYLHNQIAVVF